MKVFAQRIGLALSVLLTVLSAITTALPLTTDVVASAPNVTTLSSPLELPSRIGCPKGKTCLGTCIDLCLDANYQNCASNYCSKANECIRITLGGISSINFAGDMRCDVFNGKPCDYDGHWFTFTQAVPDLSAFYDWNDHVQSVQCMRFS